VALTVFKTDGGRIPSPVSSILICSRHITKSAFGLSPKGRFVLGDLPGNPFSCSNAFDAPHDVIKNFPRPGSEHFLSLLIIIKPIHLYFMNPTHL